MVRHKAIKERGTWWIYARRPLRNGQTFLIVKVLHDLHLIEKLLGALGFTVMIQKLDDCFFFLEAQRKA